MIKTVKYEKEVNAESQRRFRGVGWGWLGVPPPPLLMCNYRFGIHLENQNLGTLGSKKRKGLISAWGKEKKKQTKNNSQFSSS